MTKTGLLPHGVLHVADEDLSAQVSWAAADNEQGSRFVSEVARVCEVAGQLWQLSLP